MPIMNMIIRTEVGSVAVNSKNEVISYYMGLKVSL